MSREEFSSQVECVTMRTVIVARNAGEVSDGYDLICPGLGFRFSRASRFPFTSRNGFVVFLPSLAAFDILSSERCRLNKSHQP